MKIVKPENHCLYGFHCLSNAMGEAEQGIVTTGCRAYASGNLGQETKSARDEKCEETRLHLGFLAVAPLVEALTNLGIFI